MADQSQVASFLTVDIQSDSSDVVSIERMLGSEPRRDCKYPGIETVIHGNGAVAHVMSHVCGGVIGYPITPSTEISELYEAFRAQGGCNAWGKHPFFFEPEGEHSAQSGALGAALTGGKYISNASSSQGILYGLESHYVTVGKKIGGFVLHVAARVVSRHSLNVMAGHDDVYALLPSGYTILFGSNPQEAADLAAIAYRVSALSLIPVTNAMDGFATSHMQSETLLPEPELLKEFLGDPQGRIKTPTLAQEMLYGAKGRVYQLRHFLTRHRVDIPPLDLKNLEDYLDQNGEQTERDEDAGSIRQTLAWIPEELHAKWRRQWRNAYEKGTRQLVPALVDVHDPGLTGGVQNQPDFQAGVADHRTHFANEVPRFVRQAMQEYADLTGRIYSPVNSFLTDDAEYVLVGMGSVTDDAEAVSIYLRRQGKKVGVVSIKLLHPFPEAELVEALRDKKAVTVLERCDATTLTNLVTQALFKARENDEQIRHRGIPSISQFPKISTAVFGLGAHDLQPRHLIAAYENMESETNIPFYYLGSQFFSENPSPYVAALQDRLRDAYPETEFMALETGENPHMLPAEAFRLRFHSVGGYGTIATGKLLTDILSGVLDLESKSSPKYGSEKSGAPTNFYITLSPQPIKITNAELEEVEIVVSPDHKVFSHTDPLRGLAAGGTFILQSHHDPLEVWKELPSQARKTIRDKRIQLYIVNAFAVAKKYAPTADLEIRMMGIAFIGAVCGHVDRVVSDASQDIILNKIHEQIRKKFGAKGEGVVEGNMRVIKEGLQATLIVDYDNPAYREAEQDSSAVKNAGVGVSASMVNAACSAVSCGFFDKEYFNEVISNRFKDGTIGEAPVLPGSGMFMPVASAAWRDKGLFRLTVPKYIPHLCTGCLECALVCPDAAIPNTVHEIHDLLLIAINGLDIAAQQRVILSGHVFALSTHVRESYRSLPRKDPKPFHELVAQAVAAIDIDNTALRRHLDKMVAVLEDYPVARTRPFFDVMEKSSPGSGGLFSVNVDPWKCSGCMECVEVCGPGALQAQPQSREISAGLQSAFALLSKLPNTPRRFHGGRTREGGDTKRLILDHDNYYAMTGGHGACRGCGEVTAIRLIMAVNTANHRQRYKEHIEELEHLIERLTAKIEAVKGKPGKAAKLQRLQDILETLEKRLYYFESGPTGKGPASAMIANATGCSSVYASTFPYNPYTDPWVNSLFQDTAPVAKGLFEGMCTNLVEDYKAIRMGSLEIEDRYEPETHDAFFKYFHWRQFSVREFELLPAVISLGGDGATYDIGFGALSRVLTTTTPIKFVVLNTGSYSNTGGQASTASFTAQDSDLSRFGATHSGKQERRKELGLIAAFHPAVFVIQTSAALQGHFLKHVMSFFSHNDSPALLDVYTTCQSEHGIADDGATRRARLAVESRMNPVFVHDPGAGDTLAERFSLQGNPEVDKDWAKGRLEYLDDDGNTEIKEFPLTPADFAVNEGRFKKHFKPLRDEGGAVSVHRYVGLGVAERHGKHPYIWSMDSERRLVMLAVSPSIIALTEERLANWRMLQYLSGLHVVRLQEHHRRQLEEWQQKYQHMAQDREHSMDVIASGMSELAAISSAPALAGQAPVTIAVTAISSAASKATPKEHGHSAQMGLPLVSIAADDMPKCTDCKACYQDLGELFEKTSIMAENGPKQVSRVKPGILDTIELTPELIDRASRIADECDAEIIRFCRP